MKRSNMGEDDDREDNGRILSTSSTAVCAYDPVAANNKPYINLCNWFSSDAGTKLNCISDAVPPPPKDDERVKEKKRALSLNRYRRFCDEYRTKDGKPSKSPLVHENEFKPEVDGFGRDRGLLGSVTYKIPCDGACPNQHGAETMLLYTALEKKLFNLLPQMGGNAACTNLEVLLAVEVYGTAHPSGHYCMGRMFAMPYVKVGKATAGLATDAIVILNCVVSDDKGIDQLRVADNDGLEHAYDGIHMEFGFEDYETAYT